MNFSGLLFEAIHYEVDQETETIDYDRLREQALAERPKMIVGGASAYPRFWDYESLRSIADEIEAVLLFDMAHIAGLVAGGVHPSPVPHCDVVTSTTHKTLRGPRGGLVLSTKDHFKAINKMNFPGHPGRPADARDRGQGRLFPRVHAGSTSRTTPGSMVDNAAVLGEALLERGFHLVSGGTDNHLLLVNVSNKGLTGKDMEELLEHVGITANKNTVPFDQESPFVTSGIRLGTPALTTRGMGPERDAPDRRHHGPGRAAAARTRTPWTSLRGRERGTVPRPSRCIPDM